jgi:hypothetical protein
MSTKVDIQIQGSWHYYKKNHTDFRRKQLYNELIIPYTYRHWLQKFGVRITSMPDTMGAPASGFDLLRHFSPPVPQWRQSPFGWQTWSTVIWCWKPDIPTPVKKKHSTDERNDTSYKSHVCVGRTKGDRSNELCLCCAHPDRGRKFQPFLKNWLTEKTEQGNNTLWDVEEDLPISRPACQ